MYSSKALQGVSNLISCSNLIYLREPVTKNQTYRGNGKFDHNKKSLYTFLEKYPFIWKKSANNQTPLKEIELSTLVAKAFVCFLVTGSLNKIIIT